MKILTALAILLAASALTAQDSSRSLDARIQVFGDFNQPKKFTYYNVPGTTNGVTDQAGNQAGLGFRILGEFPYTSGWYYELGGRFESSSYLKLNDAYVNATDIQLQYSYWSAGFGYLWHSGPAAFGLHLEGRGEALCLQGKQVANNPAVLAGNVSKSQTYLRPWVRASVDFTFGNGKVRPYAGVEGSFALTRTTQYEAVPLVRLPDGSWDGIDARTIQSIAPDFSIGAYVGLRF